jgi:ectoine hydroxylase-related dioxygenase (phytanoyl-CoA dioxygenase family)
MMRLFSCLNRATDWAGNNELVVRSPEIDAEWLGPRTPHLDFPVYDRLCTLANSIFYLQDVSEFGAPFMYWPGSHKAAWDYFKKNPKDYMAQGDLSQDQVFKKITDSMPNKAIVFDGKAGDLMIWNSLLLHSASVNKSHSARIAIIGRWGNTISSNENNFDFDSDMWQSWDFNT